MEWLENSNELLAAAVPEFALTSGKVIRPPPCKAGLDQLQRLTPRQKSLFLPQTVGELC